MSFSYYVLHRINRAIETFLQPENYSHMKCLEGIRILWEYRNRKITYNLMPSENELRERLLNLSISIITENNRQTMDELMDTCIELRIGFGEVQRFVENQRIEIERYQTINIPAPNRNTRPTATLQNFNRLVEEYEEKKKTGDIFSLKNISGDRQNVHHSSINDNVKNTLVKLCNEYPSTHLVREWYKWVQILKDRKSWKEKNDISLKYIYSCTGSFGIGITLKQMFLSLFMFIQKHIYRDELLDRLNEELEDMSGTCSTGHMSRLINVLQGYSDEYSISIDPEKYMKTWIYNSLNNLLKDAPSDIQDGILEKTDKYLEFIRKETSNFVKKFGVINEKFILETIEKFISGT